MMNSTPIAPVGALGPAPEPLGALASAAPTGLSFSNLISGGLEQVNSKVAHADAMVSAFALDDSIPVHQVTYALEQARLSVELMMQVRSRLLEGYQEVLRMQL